MRWMQGSTRRDTSHIFRGEQNAYPSRPQAAVKAANALLSKFPGDQLGMVLKSLALFNLHKHEEAHQVL